MKKCFYITSIIICALSLTKLANAQQGFGTNAPSTSSVIDMVASDKGALLPRVALNSTIVAAPVTAPSNALTVFNTATTTTGANDVFPGYYYWLTNKWVRLLDDPAALKIEPWFKQGTSMQATLNTDNIYQTGNVSIQKAANLTGTSLDVAGAVRVGSNLTGTVGLNSFAAGTGNTASGANSSAFGANNTVTGANSNAIGLLNTVSGSISGANGASNNVSANGAFAAGALNTVAGTAYVIGNSNTVAAGATGGFLVGTSNSLAASAIDANVQGQLNTITGSTVAVQGRSNTASADFGYTIGKGNINRSFESIVFGRWNAMTTVGSLKTEIGTDQYFELANGTSAALADRRNIITILKNGKMGLNILGQDDLAKPTESFDVGSGNVRIRDINNAYAAVGTERIVVADGSGVLKTVSSTTPKFFYMPSVIIPTASNQFVAEPGIAGESFGTINLYARYNKQFGSPAVSSPGAPSLPVVPSNQLYFYVTWYDTNVFASVSVSATGVLTYTVQPNADVTAGSFMNIVFAIK